MRIFVLALSHYLTLQSLTALPKGPSAAPVVSMKVARACLKPQADGTEASWPKKAYSHITALKPQGPSLLTGSATQG